MNQGILNMRIGDFEFFEPHWLWLLLLLPVILWLMWNAEANRPGEWKFSGLASQQKKMGSPFIITIRRVLMACMGIVLALLIIALAKPIDWADHIDNNHDYKDGIDIILTIDISGSMLEQDFQPNRIEVAKKVAKDFVDGRKGDRIGLVAYAGEAYTACPATTDYTVLNKQIDGLTCYANIEGGTAIGVGLGTAVSRLRSDSIPSKVIILLTDGSNNAGTISPEEATELAKSKNVRVYTIGVKGESVAVQTPFGVINSMVDSDLDEKTLINIADKTGGKYFRAKDEQSLRAIYTEIEKMEKRKIIDMHFQAEPPAQPQKYLKWALLFALAFWITPRLLFRQND